MKKRVGIVDGSSTGILLAPEFRRRGHECVHIQSAPKVPDILAGAMAFRPEDYVQNVVHDGNLGQTIDALRPNELCCVVPGAETGVELADALSNALGLPSNHSANASARRDKFEMIKALQARGLTSIPSAKVGSVEAALDWISQTASFPVVIKPTKSVGTDGVTLCDSEQDVRAAFRKLLGQPNAVDLRNNELLVQAFVSGPEYIVDTVSRNGRHCVTDVWVYSKRIAQNSASFVYDHAWLLPYSGETQEQLYQYAFKVLDALGILYGAAHCEIVMTDTEPVLIEVGARLCGGLVPLLCRAAMDSSQLEATVDAYVDPVSFDSRLSVPYSLSKNALRVLLISDVEGVIKELPFLQQIRQLESFHEAHVSVKPGDVLHKTTNFFTHPGKIDLVHPKREVLLGDLQKIREWESGDFYRVEAQTKE